MKNQDRMLADDECGFEIGMIFGIIKSLKKISQKITDFQERIKINPGSKEEASLVVKLGLLCIKQRKIKDKLRTMIGEIPNLFAVTSQLSTFGPPLENYKDYRYPTARNFELAQSIPSNEQMFAHKSLSAAKLLREARTKEEIEHAITELMHLAEKYPTSLDFNMQKEREAALITIRNLQAWIRKLERLTMMPETAITTEDKELATEMVTHNIELIDNSPVMPDASPEELN